MRPLFLFLLPAVIACRTAAPDGAEPSADIKAPAPTPERDEGDEEELPADDSLSSVDKTLSRDDGSTWTVVPATRWVMGQGDILPDGTFAGTVATGIDHDGSPACSLDYDVTGTPWAGDCEGCSFAFEMSSTQVAAENPDSCWSQPSHTFEVQEGHGIRSVILSHMDTWTSPAYEWTDYYGNTYTWGGVTYTDLARVGYIGYTEAYSGPYGEWPASEWGPYFTNFLWEGSPYGDFDRDGDTLTWSMLWSYNHYASEGIQNWCGGDEYVVSAPANGDLGSGAVTGSFACDPAIHEAWTFSALAGDEVVITVDTVDEETTFDPMFWVNGPDTCSILWADDNFDCTVPPPAFSCPSLKFEAPDDGTYELFISTTGTCAGETAGYALDVQAR
jgi:hypothetical protein